MTMPHERTRAVLGTAEILNELADQAKHPELSEETRRQVNWALRHFPTRSDICWAAFQAPDVFEHPDGPLTPEQEARRLNLLAIAAGCKSNGN